MIINKIQRVVKRLKKERKRSYELQTSDVTIVSFPKCGRTWLRVLVGKYLTDAYNISEPEIIDVHSISRQASVKTTLFTHDDKNMNKPHHYSTLSVDLSKYGNKDVVFLIREPKDVMVSWYFQINKRRGVETGTISDFIRDEGYGIKKYLTFVNNWIAASSGVRSFMLITYEDLHADTENVLSSVLKTIGVEKPPVQQLRSTIEYGSFGNMKKIEKRRDIGSKIMRPGDVNDPNSFKVRSGKVGGYNEYLSEDDIQYLNKCISEFGCSAFDRYIDKP